MGEHGLLVQDAPVHQPAKRRRLQTVIQELIYRAARLIETGRKLILGLGANDRSAKPSGDRAVSCSSRSRSDCRARLTSRIAKTAPNERCGVDH